MAAQPQTTTEEDPETIIEHEMTREEARAFFDGQARAWLGMSG